MKNFGNPHGASVLVCHWTSYDHDQYLCSFSHLGPSGILSTERYCGGWRRRSRISCHGAEATCSTVSFPTSPYSISYDILPECPPISSRDWVCPTCKKPNLECLPDPSEGQSSHSDPASQPPARTTSSTQLQQSETRTGLIERSPQVLDAATATTVADPQIHPNHSLLSPNLIAPKPIRPIDATSIVIPTSPLPQPSPLAPAPSLPTEQPPTRASSTRAVDSQSRTQTPTPERARLLINSPARPPILLDTAICVLLVLVFALICRRIL